MVKRIRAYFEEAKSEFKRINWPNRQEVIRLTLIVIGFSLATAVFLGVADTTFGYLLRKLISL